jgi:hypothetical protein
MPVLVNVRVAVIAVFTVADTVCVDGDSEAAATVIVIVAVAVAVPVAVMVTAAALCDAVGVPDTTPVEVSRLSPVGSVPVVTA